jgi:signal transduction histidine kinase
LFGHVRFQLTLLYTLAALALIVVMGAGAYRLLSNYFQTSTDLALEYRMAQEFRRAGVALTSELLAAERDWQRRQGIVPGADLPRTTRGPEEEHESEGHEGEQKAQPPARSPGDESFDVELAPLFVLRLTSQGSLIVPAGTAAPPFSPDRDALAAAQTQGRDLRTVQQPDGIRVRLLSQAVQTGTEAGIFQIGRVLSDQERTLNRLLLGLIALGGFATVLVGAGSWWMAGRSLAPAQEAWERQQAFVANASHELRTPLTLLRASAEVAQRSLPASAADTHELLDDVLRESDHMAQLVNDLLLLSRLDSGALVLDWQMIDLPALLADVGREVGRVAARQGVRLNIEPATGNIWGDQARLRQVLLIVLDNAVQHTPAGGVITLVACEPSDFGFSILDFGSQPRDGDRILHYDRPRPAARQAAPRLDKGREPPGRRRPTTSESATRLPGSWPGGASHSRAGFARQSPVVRITVEDTGRGIAPEHQPHVFERFFRADSARSNGGAGLGLSIAKGLVEMQHGQIWIESRPGEGTRVTIELPLA